MAKVYIVTAGYYSDYGIEAVFSIKEVAEKYAEAISRRYQPSVEEWDLDPNADDIKNGRRPFFVRITKEGNVTECSTDCKLIDGFGYDIHENLFTSVWAEDENHAHKIAAEIHAVVIANGEWGKGTRTR